MQQDIYQSLARLEQTLQAIEGARQQVKNVTDSYAGCATQFHDIASTLQELGDGMKQFIDSVKNHQETLDGKILAMAESRLENFSASVEALRNMSQQMNTTFRDGCDQGLQSFQSTTQNAVTTFKGSLDHANRQQQESLIKVSSDFDTSVRQYLDKIEKTEKDLSDFAHHVEANNEKLLNQITQAVNVSRKNLLDRLDTTTTSILAALKDIETKVDHIASRQEEIFSDQKDTINALQQQFERRNKTTISFIVASAVILLLAILFVR